jgi:hypothetical protein
VLADRITNKDVVELADAQLCVLCCITLDMAIILIAWRYLGMDLDKSKLVIWMNVISFVLLFLAILLWDMGIPEKLAWLAFLFLAEAGLVVVGLAE